MQANNASLKTIAHPSLVATERNAYPPRIVTSASAPPGSRDHNAATMWWNVKWSRVNMGHVTTPTEAIREYLRKPCCTYDLCWDVF